MKSKNLVFFLLFACAANAHAQPLQIHKPASPVSIEDAIEKDLKKIALAALAITAGCAFLIVPAITGPAITGITLIKSYTQKKVYDHAGKLSGYRKITWHFSESGFNPVSMYVHRPPNIRSKLSILHQSL